MKGRLNASHPIGGLSCTIGDFWSWAYSNLNENTVRPIFAEFLVGSLLGIPSEGRTEWDSFDLLYGSTRVEVKSSAYVQSWHQERASTPTFDIAPKTGWDRTTNTYDTVVQRQADVYVFCLYPERDRTRADPLDVDAWRFWVVSSYTLNTRLGAQKSMRLSTLSRLAEPIGASELRATVDAVLAESHAP